MTCEWLLDCTLAHIPSYFSYAHNSRLLSEKLARNPFKPAEKFIKWVEFAAEYSDLNELNLPYHEWSFFTYYSLDAILFTLAGLAVVAASILLTLRTLVSMALAVSCQTDQGSGVGRGDGYGLKKLKSS